MALLACWQLAGHQVGLRRGICLSRPSKLAWASLSGGGHRFPRAATGQVLMHNMSCNALLVSCLLFLSYWPKKITQQPRLKR